MQRKNLPVGLHATVDAGHLSCESYTKEETGRNRPPGVVQRLERQQEVPASVLTFALLKVITQMDVFDC
eukprot:scaffold42847_cov234-Skeletonema_marinoi.AAC.1